MGWQCPGIGIFTRSIHGFGYGVGYKRENLVYLELRRAGFEFFAGILPHKEVDDGAIQRENASLESSNSYS